MSNPKSPKTSKKSKKTSKNLGEITLIQGHHVYEKVDLSPLTLELDKSHQPVTKIIYERKIFNFRIRIFPLLANAAEQAPCYTLLRNYDDFVEFDNHLHTCPDNIPNCVDVLEKREYTQLHNLINIPNPNVEENVSYVSVRDAFANYISRLGSLIKENPTAIMRCNEVLNWFCLDNMGRHITVIQDDINQPGAYTGQCVKEYVAQCQDELSMKPGDPITVLKICKPSESGWWYGKNKFNVGYFPFDCIKLLATDGDTQELLDSFAPRLSEVGKKHGKKIVTLKELLEKRPNQEELRRKKILKDPPPAKSLSDYIHDPDKTPWVVEVCIQYINKYGVVSGVYRKPGSIVNVELLRQLFSRESLRLTADELVTYAEIKNDQYCVASFLKAFFRDLRDPLLLSAVFKTCEEARKAHKKLEARKDAYITALQSLPPDHWNTLKLLMTHLYELSREDHITNMNADNLARIWISNLVRHQGQSTGVMMPTSDLSAIEFMKANVCQDGDIIADLIKLVPDIFGYQKPVQDVEKFLNAKRSLKLQYIGSDEIVRSNTTCDLTNPATSYEGGGRRYTAESTKLPKSGKSKFKQKMRSTSAKNLTQDSSPSLTVAATTSCEVEKIEEKENLTTAEISRAEASDQTKESKLAAKKSSEKPTPSEGDAGATQVLKSNSSARNSSNSDECVQSPSDQIRIGTVVDSQKF